METIRAGALSLMWKGLDEMKALREQFVNTEDKLVQEKLFNKINNLYILNNALHKFLLNTYEPK